MKKTGLTVKNRASCRGLAFSARNWLSSRGFVAARLVKVERRSSRYTVHSIKSVAGASQRRRSRCYRIGIFGIGTKISNRIGTGINICKILFIKLSKAYVRFLSPVRKPHVKENHPHWESPQLMDIDWVGIFLYRLVVCQHRRKGIREA